MSAKSSWCSVFTAILLLGASAHAEEEHGRPARAPAPKFQPHPGGVHPRGPTVRAHATRVLAPAVVVHGHASWSHWGHPEFVRPVYYWSWGAVRSVSCTAEDSYGDQYPVTENWSAGWGLDNMTSVEDDALDRCYSESGGDTSCVLATCSHF
jgi:hypothetical protein